jgi:hypothetical protein
MTREELMKLLATPSRTPSGLLPLFVHLMTNPSLPAETRENLKRLVGLIIENLTWPLAKLQMAIIPTKH